MKPKPLSLSDIQKELNQLLERSRIEKTDKYDDKIKQLQQRIDFVCFGIK